MAKGSVKKLSSGCLFWIIFFILISSLFIVNKNKIAGVLEKTRANTLFFKTPSEDSGNTGKGETEELSQTSIQPITFDTTHTDDTEHEPAGAAADSTGLETGIFDAADPEQPQPHTASDAAHTTASSNSSGSISSSADNTENPHTAGSELPMRSFTLYWIRIDSDGTILRQAKTHIIPHSDSPLTDVLTLLLKQPAEEKEKNSVLSLIPAGTQLRSVRVQDSIAFIDLSDEFQFNQYGIEGYLAQLAQIVFTATEFSTVDAVQILIEGQKKEYLGSEGVWIGTPLTRNLF
ncbi:MAG: GerMN domain-containing protein [Treponema sp.]